MVAFAGDIGLPLPLPLPLLPLLLLFATIRGGEEEEGAVVSNTFATTTTEQGLVLEEDIENVCYKTREYIFITAQGSHLKVALEQRPVPYISGGNMTGRDRGVT